MTQKPILGLSVITGGSSGIGEACARELARRGTSVVIADINPRGKEIAESIGGYFYSIDVTQDEEVNETAASIEKDLGPVRNLINCAGIIQQPLPPQALLMEVWYNIVRVDQRGTYLTSVAFAKYMI